MPATILIGRYHLALYGLPAFAGAVWFSARTFSRRAGREGVPIAVRPWALTAAALFILAKAEFAHLKTTLQVTDGNLGRHVQVLDEAGLITIQKQTENGRPRTWVKVTRKGRAALRRELQALNDLIADIERNDRTPERRRITPSPAPEN